jgi:DNA-binding LacI/PurR family transcriptional regulator
LYRRQPDYEQKLQQLLADSSSAILLLMGTELGEDRMPNGAFCKPRRPWCCWIAPLIHLNFDAVLMDNENSVAQAVDYLISQRPYGNRLSAGQRPHSQLYQARPRGIAGPWKCTACP